MKPARLLAVATSILAAALLTGAIVPHALADKGGVVIKIAAKRYEFNPSEIKLKKGVPVTFEFSSLDRPHGFNCPELGIRSDIMPGKANRIHFVPRKSGTFEFHCDIFCGEGHDTMTGKIIVSE